MTIYVVTAVDYEDFYIEKAFAVRADAEEYIEQQATSKSEFRGAMYYSKNGYSLRAEEVELVK